VVTGAQRYAALSGIVVALLFGTGTALWAFEMPEPSASAAEVVDFYRNTSGRIVAGASLSLVAIAVFVLFASGLRRVLTEAEGNDVLGTAAFGGGLLAVTAGLGAETINMVGALRAQDGQLTDALGEALFQISYILGFNAAGVGIGVLALATAAVALRTGTVLPRWLAVVTVVLGLTLLTPLSRVVLGPSVLLLPVIAILLLRAPRGDRRAGSGA
jgi:hypothetical protein